MLELEAPARAQELQEEAVVGLQSLVARDPTRGSWGEWLAEAERRHAGVRQDLRQD